jgi:O-glycosyl hydrolase
MNGDNESLIQLDGAAVLPSGRLRAFANFSRFVRPGAVRIGATTTDSGLTIDAFRNTDKSVAVVALNAAAGPSPVTFKLQNTAIPNGAVVTPYLTDDSSAVAAQPRIHVSDGAFTWTLPSRSLVTSQLPASAA